MLLMFGPFAHARPGGPTYPVPVARVLIFTHKLTESRSLIPLKSNENPAISSPSPRFGERGPGGEG